MVQDERGASGAVAVDLEGRGRAHEGRVTGENDVSCVRLVGHFLFSIHGVNRRGQLLGRWVRVDLRRGQAGVPEGFLDDAEVCDA